MRAWRDFIKGIEEKGTSTGKSIKMIDELTSIISTIVTRRIELGLSQRDLAALCKLPQSSIARIESCVVIPKLDTLIKIIIPLGLTISIQTI